MPSLAYFALASVLMLLGSGCLSAAPNVSPPTLEPLTSTRRTVVHATNGSILPDAAFGEALPVFEQRFVAERAAGEPTIGVTSKGVAIYPSIAFDAAAGNLARTEVYRSRDSGVTWEEVTPQTMGMDAPPISLDPFVYADPLTDRVFTIDLYVGCSYLSYSDDEGTTWKTEALACGVPVNDHQSLAAGPPREGTTTKGYANVLYYCVNQIAQIMCSRSLDGGSTWLPSTAAALRDTCSALTGHVHASPKDGTVYLPYGCNGANGAAHVLVSHDNGVEWSDAVVADDLGFVGHDGSVATDASGNAYYLWLADETFPYLSVSRDQGRTWGEPVNVTRPGVTVAKFPAVAAGDEGRIAVLYVGSNVTGGWKPDADAIKDARWNAYIGVSVNALNSTPIFATTVANPLDDPLKRGACAGRCQGMFDFLDLQTNPKTGDVWAALVDLCTGKCAGPTGKASDPILSRGAVGVQVDGARLRLANAS